MHTTNAGVGQINKIMSLQVSIETVPPNTSIAARKDAQEAYKRAFGPERATIERAFGVLKQRVRYSTLKQSKDM